MYAPRLLGKHLLLSQKKLSSRQFPGKLVHLSVPLYPAERVVGFNCPITDSSPQTPRCISSEKTRNQTKESFVSWGETKGLWWEYQGGTHRQNRSSWPAQKFACSTDSGRAAPWLPPLCPEDPRGVTHRGEARWASASPITEEQEAVWMRRGDEEAVTASVRTCCGLDTRGQPFPVHACTTCFLFFFLEFVPWCAQSQ